MPKGLRGLLMGVYLGGIALLGSWACTQERPQVQELHFLMWKPHQPRPLEEAIARFEADHPGVRVVRHIGSENASQYYRELTTKLRNRDPELDVFFLDVIWPPEFVARGWLVDLTDRLSQEEWEDFFPGSLQAVTVGGRRYAVPFNMDVGLLFYRKDLLEKYGFEPPKTWRELLHQVDTILAGEGKSHPDLIGYAGQFEKYEGLVCNLLEFIASAGGNFLDEQGQPAVTRPAVIQALRFVRDELLHNREHPRRASRYLLTAKEQESRDLFARGDAIFLRNWPETWGILTNPERSRVHDRVGIAQLPAFEEGGRRVGTLGGWQLGIAAHSPRKDLAWALIRHMTSPDVQKALALGKAQTMARRSIYQDPELLQQLPHFGKPGPWGAPLREILLTAVPRPRSVRYNALSERIQRYMHEAIRHPDSDIPALMAELARQMEREQALARAGGAS